MKCPKCTYVGFEAADRCRHCGYDFSFMTAPDADPPALRAVESSRLSSYREPLRAAAAEPDLARVDSAPLVDLPLSEPSSPLAAVTSSLFDSQPPPARTPLAVRRTAERPRSRTTPQVVRRPRPVLLDAPSDAGPDAGAAEAGDGASVVAPAAARVVSALVDVSLMAAIDVAVVYLTTQMAAVPLAEVATLPLVPLAAFLLGLNVAYLAIFTANGGQTLGKMAMGLRVEATDGALTFGNAVVRVAATIAGGLAMGAGFVPALWRADRRAVHDQIAHTRVVKVTAC